MKKKNIAMLLAAVVLFGAVFISPAGAAVSYAEGWNGGSGITVKSSENCTVDIDGSTITVTDTDDNNDVWNSKALFDTGMKLEVGREYMISFAVDGEYGAGEFFLCKGENIDKRYDESFTNDYGTRGISFKATSTGLFFGIQCGSLGKGNSVSVSIDNICPLDETDCPSVLRTENCSVKVDGDSICVTDTSDNNDVWNSKLLFDTGLTLEPGKTYQLDFSMLGENGIGEFFVCKSADLNNRYDETFTGGDSGNKSVKFCAVTDRLLIGMQMGNLGNGNSVSFSLKKLSEASSAPVYIPPVAPNVNCSYTVDGNKITVTDTSNNNDVWDSKLVYDAGISMVPGEKYEITVSLKGDNGVGEFFLLKSDNIDDRYDSFTDKAGVRTYIITAESDKAYIGMQLGNVGKGNSVTAELVSVQPYDESTGGEPGIKTAQNCDFSVNTADDKIVIIVKDSSADNDVWTSNAVYYVGSVLEEDRYYMADVNLQGDNGTGEFFFLKSDDLGDRYSFDNTVGDHEIIFEAVGDKLYAGAQFGDIGEGNEAVYTIEDIVRIPGVAVNSEGCEISYSEDTATITDTNSEEGVWTSKVVFDTGYGLISGKEYSVTYSFDGNGEFFLKRGDNIYDNSDMYEGNWNEAVTDKNVIFTADVDGNLFILVQSGKADTGSECSFTVSEIAELATPTALCLSDEVVTEEAQAAEEAPAVEEAPAAEEVPAVEEAPAAAPAAEEAPAAAEAEAE